MSIDTLVLVPVVAALSLATAWSAAGVVLSVWTALAGRWPSLARWALVVAAVPWVVGAVVAVAAVFPGDPHLGQMLSCHCSESMPSWLHLCPIHPGDAALLALPATAVLLVLVPGRVRALLTLAREPLGHGGGAQPVITVLEARVALLVGWLRPSLVVDRELWKSLSEPDRQALVAHEQAHLERRDPMTLMVLRSLLVVAPARMAHEAARAWLGRAEQAADSEAARMLGDPLQVAAALVRCGRMGRDASLALQWTGGSLEHRVHALLDRKTPAQPARPDAGLIDVAALVALAIVALAATPWIHHHVEHLINLSL